MNSYPKMLWFNAIIAGENSMMRQQKGIFLSVNSSRKRSEANSTLQLKTLRRNGDCLCLFIKYSLFPPSHKLKLKTPRNIVKLK